MRRREFPIQPMPVSAPHPMGSLTIRLIPRASAEMAMAMLERSVVQRIADGAAAAGLTLPEGMPAVLAMLALLAFRWDDPELELESLQGVTDVLELDDATLVRTMMALARELYSRQAMQLGFDAIAIPELLQADPLGNG